MGDEMDGLVWGQQEVLFQATTMRLSRTHIHKVINELQIIIIITLPNKRDIKF